MKRTPAMASVSRSSTWTRVPASRLRKSSLLAHPPRVPVESSASIIFVVAGHHENRQPGEGLGGPDDAEHARVGVSRQDHEIGARWGTEMAQCTEVQVQVRHQVDACH
jgi:hypothetical protein